MPICAGLIISSSARAGMASEKARLQIDLEPRLDRFEHADVFALATAMMGMDAGNGKSVFHETNM